MSLFGDYLPNLLPDDPDKNAAARQGLLALGATMMGSRGNFGESLGNGLLAGSNGYAGMLAQQGQQQLRAAQLKQTGLENDKLQAGVDTQKEGNSILARHFSSGTPGASAERRALPQIGQPRPQVAQPTAPMGGANFNMGYGNDAPEAMPDMPQQAAPAPAQQATQAGDREYEMYMSAANDLAAIGDPRAKNFYEQAEKRRPEVRDVAELTIDGKPVMVQMFKDGRPPQVLDNFAPKREKVAFQNTGGSTLALDPFTGKPVNTIKNSQSPDSVASNATTIRGQNMTAATAAAGDQAPISTGAIDNAAARYNFDGTLPPMGMGKNAAAGRSAILNRAAELKSGIDPEQQRRDQINNRSDLATQASAIRSFATGKDGQAIQSANTALNHLATIRTLAEAQKNGDVRAFNQAARALGAQFGSPAPTNLNAALTMVGPEVSKAVVGVNGTGHEREQSIQALNPNGSIDQIIGGTHTMEELFTGRLSEARRTYERTTKKTDFDKTMLSPAAQRLMGAAPAAPAAIKTVGELKKTAPPAGTVKGGFRFNGKGDAGNPANWEKVQ